MSAYSLPANYPAPRIATAYQVGKAVTPADNTSNPFAGLYVGGAGDVTVMMRNGDGAGNLTAVLFKAVPVGTILPIAIQGVNSTGTTATNLVGLG